MAQPSFIGIGMQKAGTRWLYLQFRHHPGAWLPPLKELHAFGGTFPSAKVRKALARRANLAGADAAFRDRVLALPPSRNHGLALYRSLFEPGGARVTGEITPAYSALPEEAVARLGRDLAGTRVLLLARDPVERAWSALNDMVNQGRLPGAAVREEPAMLAALGAEGVRRRSRPSEALARWGRHFPVRAFLFDDLVARPDALRGEVAAALGLDPRGPWGIEAGWNGKAGRARAPLTPALRAALAGHFRDELLASARLFGGAAEGWPGRYGL